MQLGQAYFYLNDKSLFFIDFPRGFVSILKA